MFAEFFALLGVEGEENNFNMINIFVILMGLQSHYELEQVSKNSTLSRKLMSLNLMSKEVHTSIHRRAPQKSIKGTKVPREREGLPSPIRCGL